MLHVLTMPIQLQLHLCMFLLREHTEISVKRCQMMSTCHLMNGGNRGKLLLCNLNIGVSGGFSYRPGGADRPLAPLLVMKPLLLLCHLLNKIQKREDQHGRFQKREEKHGRFQKREEKHGRFQEREEKHGRFQKREFSSLFWTLPEERRE